MSQYVEKTYFLRLETYFRRIKLPTVMTEKRRLERFAFNVPARVVIPGSGGSGEIHGRTRDLSAKGAFLFLGQNALAVGESVELEIELSFDSNRAMVHTTRETCMRGRGTITRQEAEGLAIVFEGRLRFES